VQKIDRVPSGHAGRSRSCAYDNLVWTVATSPDVSLDIAGQTRQALAALSANLEGLGSGDKRMLSAQVLLASMGDKAVVDGICGPSGSAMTRKTRRSGPATASTSAASC